MCELDFTSKFEIIQIIGLFLDVSHQTMDNSLNIFSKI